MWNHFVLMLQFVTVSLCHYCLRKWFVAYGPLARYVKLWFAHAPRMPGTFSPTPRVSDPDMHRGTCVTHVPWCMPGSVTSGFLWSRWRGKRSRHSRRMRNPQLYVSGKRPIRCQAINSNCRVFVINLSLRRSFSMTKSKFTHFHLK